MSLLLDRCGSTQDEIKIRLNSSTASGFWVATKEQDRGRGRSGNAWTTPLGSLAFSVAVRWKSDLPVTRVPIAAALATHDFLRSELGAEGVRLKWPNDLYWNEKKLGGILCEGFNSPEGNWIIIGIGINGLTSPSGTRAPSTHLAEVLGRPFTTEWNFLQFEKLSGGILAECNAAQGSVAWPEALSRYSRASLFNRGDFLIWDEAGMSQSAVFEEYGSEAQLIVRTKDDLLREVWSGEIARIMKGDLQ